MTSNEFVLNELNHILYEGQELYELLDKEGLEGTASIKVHLWAAAINDFLNSLSDTSSFNKEFIALVRPRWKKLIGSSDDYKFILLSIGDINEVLKYATRYFPKFTFGEFNEKTETTSEQELQYKKFLETMKQQEEAINLKLKTVEFTDKMWVNIMQNYAKSPIFAVPFIILGAAVIFAVFGIFKIQDYQIDLQQLTDRAIERSKQEITEQVGDIQRELSEYGTNQKNAIGTQSAVIADDIKITGEKQKIFIATQSEIMKEQIETAVPQSVEKLVNSKDTEIDKMIGRYESDVHKIQEDLDKANQNAEAIATNLPPLQAAMEIVNPNQSSFQEAMKLLGVTAWILGGAVAFCLLSVVISIAAFVRAGRQKHSN